MDAYITQYKWIHSEKYQAEQGRQCERSGPARPSALLPPLPQGEGHGGAPRTCSNRAPCPQLPPWQMGAGKWRLLLRDGT